MQILRHVRRIGRRFRSPVVTLGAFDGVHRGHQAIFTRVSELARARGADAVVLTFEPHPAFVLSPAHAPLQLTDWRARVERMAACGIDAVVVERFTQAFSEVTAEAFVNDLLVEALGVSAIVVGHRVSFGHRRGGNAESLRRLGAQHGFSVDVVGPVRAAGAEVSSSAIRAAIAAGEISHAAALLGHDPIVAGRVVRGDQRGFQLGFPTANLRVDRWALPPDGVYAVTAVVEGDELPAVANLGLRPTFGGRARALEVHLLDWSGDLYGRRVEARFKCRLRGEMRFDGPAALIEQIGRDVRAARAVFAMESA